MERTGAQPWSWTVEQATDSAQGRKISLAHGVGSRHSGGVGMVSSSLVLFLSSCRSAPSRTFAMTTEPRKLLAPVLPNSLSFPVLT